MTQPNATYLATHIVEDLMGTNPNGIKELAHLECYLHDRGVKYIQDNNMIVVAAGEYFITVKIRRPDDVAADVFPLHLECKLMSVPQRPLAYDFANVNQAISFIKGVHAGAGLNTFI